MAKASDESQRQRAHQALTRGRRSTPSTEAKLKSWGDCDGQSELFTRQDLRTDVQAPRKS